jgi:hypothetical protein
MSVIYYYYYLFYKKVLKDTDPHMLTIMALSASEAFAVAGTLQLLSIRFFCFSPSVWLMFSSTPFFLTMNYLLFYKSGRYKTLLKEKPKFLASNIASIILTGVFFLITASFIFWGPIYAKDLLQEYCGR